MGAKTWLYDVLTNAVTRTAQLPFLGGLSAHSFPISDTIPNSYDMTDYLDVRVRGRSESVYTEASTTVASLPSSPLPIPKPPPSALLGAQVGPKVLSNTILKSHGRPPWYYLLDFAFKYRELLNAFVQVWRGWPADLARFCHWDSWYVDGLFVPRIAITPISHFLRRFFQRKGSPTFTIHCLPLVL